MKKILCFLIISCLVFNGVVFSVPTNSISITNPTDGTVVSAEDESTRYNEITTKYGAHSHTDILTDFTDNTLTIGDGAAGNKNYAVDTDNAGNPTLRFSTTTESWQVSTVAGAFPGRLTVSGIVDLDQDTGILVEKTSDEDKVRIITATKEKALFSIVDTESYVQVNAHQDEDGDTQIQVEQSADEDIVRVDIAGTETIVFGDGTTEELSLFTNPGTNHGQSIQQNGVLATGDYGLFVYSNAIQNNSYLVRIWNDNASSTFGDVFIFGQSTGHGLFVDKDSTVLASGKHGLLVNSAANTTNADSALLALTSSDAGTSEPIFEITYAGGGNVIQTDAGAGTPAHLANDGTWTDASSMYADKLNITEIASFKSFVTKLKTLKLFNYQKKWDVYKGMEDDLVVLGTNLTNEEKDRYKENEKFWQNKKEYIRKGNEKFEIIGRKYKSVVTNPTARYYNGFILDDTSTPEDLIPRDKDDNISGVSPTMMANFLLGICKEQQRIIDDLEARVTALEP